MSSDADPRRLFTFPSYVILSYEGGRTHSDSYCKVVAHRDGVLRVHVPDEADQNLPLRQLYNASIRCTDRLTHLIRARFRRWPIQDSVRPMSSGLLADHQV